MRSLIGGGDDDGVFDVCVGRLDYELLCEHHLKTPEQCLNSVKIEAIEEMFNNMPASGFNKLRDQGNWMTDYVDKLRTNN